METLKKLFEKIHLTKMAFLDYAKNCQEEQNQQMFQNYAMQLQNHEEKLKEAMMQDPIDFEQLKLVAGEWMIAFKNILLLDDHDILEKAMQMISELLLLFESADHLMLVDNIAIMKDDFQIMKHQLHKNLMKTDTQIK